MLLALPKKAWLALAELTWRKTFVFASDVSLEDFVFASDISLEDL